MTTIYQVVDLEGNIRATFVFEDDARHYVLHHAPLCRIETLTFNNKRGGE